MKESDPKVRQVMSWCNRDKLSTAWLQSLPGPDGLNNQSFAEAMALILCMPSPVVKSRVGSKIGNKSIDIYGDAIQNAFLPGDDCRHRHDKIKLTISSLFKWARVPAVFDLFSHLIPSKKLFRIAGQKKTRP